MRRDIIRKDILIDGMTYQQFCKRINKAKHLLINNGAEKGQVLQIQIPIVHGNNLAFIFAGMELGMPLMVAPDDTFNPFHDDGFYEKNYNKIRNRNRFVCDYRIDGADIDIWTKVFGEKRFSKFTDMIRERCVNLEQSLIEDMPDTYTQPYDVYPSDEALSIMDEDYNPTSITYEEIERKSVFREDDIVAFGMSHHHENFFENGLIPAITTSKEMVSFNIPPVEIYGDTIKVYIANSLRNIIRKRVTAMYCLEPMPMRCMFEFMEERNWDFRETVRIVVQKYKKRTDFHDYWEAEKNIIFDFSA